MFEEAVNLCSAADTNAALGYWDKGVAYYTGSLEGGDGNSKIGTYGELTYAYAERRCVQLPLIIAPSWHLSPHSNLYRLRPHSSPFGPRPSPLAPRPSPLAPRRPPLPAHRPLHSHLAPSPL
jgi:hypothetical protein